MSVPQLSKQEFTELQSYIHQTLGIWLPDGKLTMVEQRIRPLVVESGLGSFGDFLRQRLRNPKPRDLTAFVDRITTNHTYFWREAEHFKYLVERVLPDLLRGIRQRSQRGGQLELRMWCCAASRGHEPYTLAMLQREVLGSEYKNFSAGLLATDISDTALQVAIKGRYKGEEVRSLSADLVKKYFVPRPEDEFDVVPELKRDVLYRKFNLKNPAYRFKRPFHVVFCRNVLIYFDMPTKLDVVGKICTQLEVGGYLFVGLAESLGRDVGPLRYVQPGVYRKIG